MSCFAVIVDAKLAQSTRQLLEEQGLWESRRRLVRLENGKIAIPITEYAKSTYSSWMCDKLHGLMFTVDSLPLPLSKKALLSTPYERLLHDVRHCVESKGHVWETILQDDIPRHWEKHNDLVLFPDCVFTHRLWKDLENDLWRVVADATGVSRVAKKSRITSDGYRTPMVYLLLGNNGWVEHTDNGIRYTYDVTKCMFSIGNITEKLRIAKMCCQGETIVDLYTGIGYFTLPYLVHAGASLVHACEWNLNAVEALRKSLVLNGVQDKCIIHIGNNREVCPTGVADRVNLGLIPSSEEGWPTACKALKASTGGFLHIHGNVTCGIQEGSSRQSKDSENGDLDTTSSTTEVDFKSNDCVKEESLPTSYSNTKLTLSKEWRLWAEAVSRRIEQLLIDIHNNKWTTCILHIEHVKSYAPHIDHLVLDLECRPRK
ncbi:tRNA wybutosine-synthesizing protein 2 homolog [Saccoglossus kowalevskii]|uniref:tRNA wybutosine-synthesizing protein 2 homolog n=1 Tax=Saccoglossus kowalevskii TaxID=10224 RepID=A0ABM0MF73_SACKO|nr:PREDICTED: tRNA wybutosine-synthesizing protein 2 homolog [Saccoglossus kowalevskii]